jgi:hypothetical protein
MTTIFYRKNLPTLVENENALNRNAPRADGLQSGSVVHDCEVDLDDDVHLCNSAQSIKSLLWSLSLHVQSLSTTINMFWD